MVVRTLTEMTYSVEGIPMCGQCTFCKQMFSTPVLAFADPGKATRDFYLAFTEHECRDKCPTMTW